MLFSPVGLACSVQMLLLAEQYPGLKRGLWWLLAVSVVRHHHGFRRMNLAGVYQVRTRRVAVVFKGVARMGSLALLASVRFMRLQGRSVERSPNTECSYGAVIPRGCRVNERKNSVDSVWAFT